MFYNTYNPVYNNLLLKYEHKGFTISNKKHIHKHNILINIKIKIINYIIKKLTINKLNGRNS